MILKLLFLKKASMNLRWKDSLNQIEKNRLLVMDVVNSCFLNVAISCKLDSISFLNCNLVLKTVLRKLIKLSKFLFGSESNCKLVKPIVSFFFDCA